MRRFQLILLVTLTVLIAALAVFSHFHQRPAAFNMFGMGGQIPALMYHHLVETDDELTPDILAETVTAGKFESDMKRLSESGYTAIFASEYYRSFVEATYELPEKPVIITFDDGYESNFLIAQPILRKYGFRADIFMVTDFEDGRDGKFTFLSWDQMREMEKSGDIEIQLHGKNHHDVTKITTDELEDQISAAQALIDRELGPRQFKMYAYPMSSFNIATVNLLTRMGYAAQFMQYGEDIQALEPHGFLLREPVTMDDDVLELIGKLSVRTGGTGM